MLSHAMTGPSKRVAIVTSDELSSLDFDGRALVEAFDALGVKAEAAVWSDASVGWSGFDAALIRTPWDYFKRLDEFLPWAERAAAATRLFNPLPVVLWNHGKAYLEELAARQGTDFVVIGVVLAQEGGYLAQPFVYRAEDGRFGVVEGVLFDVDMANVTVNVYTLSQYIALGVAEFPSELVTGQPLLAAPVAGS